MKYLLPIILCLLVGKLSAGDPGSIDSLVQAMEAANGTNKANLAFEVATNYINYNLSTDSVQKYAQLGIEYADRYGMQEISTGYYQLGVVAYRGGELGTAIRQLNKALSLMDTLDADLKVKRGMANVYNLLGASYWMVNDLESALKYFIESATLSEATESNQAFAAASVNIGMILDLRQRYEDALTYYQRGYEVLERENESQANNSLQLNIVNVLINMVACLNDMGNYELALEKAEEALAISEDVQYETGIQRIEQRLSTILYNLGDFQRSEAVAKANLDKLAANPNSEYATRIAGMKNLAKAQLALQKGIAAERTIQKAISYLDSCRSPYCELNVYEAAHTVYAGLGKYKKAYDYQTRYHIYNDSLRNGEKNDQLQALHSLYENERKESEIAILNQESALQTLKIQRQQGLIFGGLILVFLLIACGLLYSRSRILHEQKSAFAAEQRLLRMQMNPHFLFNALSSIQNFLFDERDSASAIHYLSKFASLMRQVLAYSRETYISVEDEISTLKNYLEIQQMRYDHQFSYDIIVDPNIKTWETMIPPILAQPFVENAIEHGQVHLVENGKISVHFKQQGDQLKLLVEDNGVGRAQAQQIKVKQYQSLATSITRERVQLLSKLWKRPLRFKIIDLPTRGTQVIFQIPIIQAH